jgi:hypothetical protein
MRSKTGGVDGCISANQIGSPNQLSLQPSNLSKVDIKGHAHDRVSTVGFRQIDANALFEVVGNIDDRWARYNAVGPPKHGLQQPGAAQVIKHHGVPVPISQEAEERTLHPPGDEPFSHSRATR